MSTQAHALDSMVRDLDALLPDLETIYKDVHSHPELSMQETRTAGLAAERLRAYGYDVAAGVGVTGVVGVLRNGHGPTVMMRADMDALPVAEATGLPYASTSPAVSHMCGHDLHVTWLLGATQLLARARSAWRGTLLAVFQPGEETAEGARAMIEDGLFERFPRPDVILGQHVMVGPSGTVAGRAGAITSAAEREPRGVVFAVAGAHRALTYGLNPVMATLLGMWTAIGGGIARDVLLAKVPIVLRAKVYAVAALLGAAIVVIAQKLQMPYVIAAAAGAAVCFGLRVVALQRGWQLPVAEDADEDGGDE